MDLFNLFVKVGVKDEASDKVDTLSTKIKGGLSTAAKVGTAAITTAATAVTALVKKSVDSYAEYEQLVGGVETLFKESAGIVEKYAANAYSAAGVSANTYMEQATAFSASLIQSLGGDTKAAAEYANTAINDMSDNANKMGTDIESIQMTYQSLMRGNYEMLDNLKLGYGGTKTELERLVSDAEKLTGEALDASKFSDVITAIHAVQENLGITGTTAKEAATTIQGSVSAMKASWENVLTAMADDNQDFSSVLDTFVESAGTALDNILPRVEIALDGAVNLVDELMPIIIDRVPTLITEYLPKITNSAVSIITTLVQGLSSNSQQIATSAMQIISTLFTGIVQNLPTILQSGLNIILTLAEGIIEYLPEIFDSLVELITTIAMKLTEPSMLQKLITVALELILALVDGLGRALPQLISVMPTIIINIATALIKSLPKILSVGIQIIESLISGVKSMFSAMSKAGSDLMSKIITAIKNKLSDIKQKGKDIINDLLSGLKEKWENVKSWFSNAWDNLFGGKSVNVNVNKSGAAVNGSHAGGLSYVPFDGYIAELHRGERVLTAQDNKKYTENANSGSGVTVNQYIYAEKQSAADLMKQALYQQKKAVTMGV